MSRNCANKVFDDNIDRHDTILHTLELPFRSYNESSKSQEKGNLKETTYRISISGLSKTIQKDLIECGFCRGTICFCWQIYDARSFSVCDIYTQVKQ